MRIKNAVRMLLPVVVMLVLTGCDGNLPFIGQKSGQTVIGEVSSLENDSITLRVGNQKEEETQGNSQDLELTGEEQEIQVTKETVIRLQNAGKKAKEEELSVSDLREGDVLSVSLDKKEHPLEILILSRGRTEETRQRREAEDYKAAAEFAVDTEIEGGNYASTGTDENAVHIYGDARVTLKNVEITRNSQDSAGGSMASLYGIGAALLTTNGTSCIRDSAISTNAPGGTGIFSDGGAVTYVLNTSVITRKSTSAGIQTAGGGTLYAWNPDVETQGPSSPAVKSDQGGGTMVLDGGAYRTDGTGSPAVFCMADTAIHEAELTANASEAVSVQGGNALRLYDCDLTGNMGDDLENDSAWNVLLYRNTSWDYDAGPALLEMKGGSLTAGNGGIFYTTNTESVITLSKVKILYPQVKDFFLKCTGNDHQGGWGKAGSNGADCLFTADSQDMEGDVVWDETSRLDFYMTNNSTLKGAVLQEKSHAGGEEDGYCNLYIEEGSTWTVTGDSTLTRLSCKGTIKDDEGDTVTVLGTDGTAYVQGTGRYTVTVLYYEMAANTSGASKLSRWSDYQVAVPE